MCCQSSHLTSTRMILSHILIHFPCLMDNLSAAQHTTTRPPPIRGKCWGAATIARVQTRHLACRVLSNCETARLGRLCWALGPNLPACPALGCPAQVDQSPLSRVQSSPRPSSAKTAWCLAELGFGIDWSFGPLLLPLPFFFFPFSSSISRLFSFTL